MNYKFDKQVQNLRTENENFLFAFIMFPWYDICWPSDQNLWIGTKADGGWYSGEGAQDLVRFRML